MSETAGVVVRLPRRIVPKKGQEFVDWAAAKAFGLWLRRARKQKGMSVGEMAKQLNVSENYVGRVEGGSRSIARHTEHLNRIAAVLKVDERTVWSLAHMRDIGPETPERKALAQIEAAASALAASTKDDHRQTGNAILEILRGGEKKRGKSV